jgi:hypothetical protein
MAKMLGCLVASMTIGAAVLDGFEPKRPDTATPRRQLIAEIRKAIYPAAEGSTLTAKWRTIRAIPVASSDTSRVHFIVHRDGNWSYTPSWQNQEPIGERGVIRIGLSTPANSAEITTTQWGAACQLRNNLQEMYKITLEGFVLSPNLRLPNETRDERLIE